MIKWLEENAHLVSDHMGQQLYSLCLNGSKVVHPQDNWNNEMDVLVDADGSVSFTVRQRTVQYVKSAQERYKRFGVRRG